MNTIYSIKQAIYLFFNINMFWIEKIFFVSSINFQNKHFLFFIDYAYFFVLILVKILLLIVPLLLAVAYLTLFERKIMASMQRRRGPNKVGVFGLFQALSDGLKLLLKEIILPSKASLIAFVIAPIVAFSLSLISWAVIPFDYELVFSDINIGVLYLFSISSLHVYGVILAGWSSNSKYSFLGSLRCAAQLISYEVSMGLLVIPIFILTESFDLIDIVDFQTGGFYYWFVFPFFPLFILFFISALAETNRPPFDLAESESELVSGYNTEYSSMTFALFFLGEYVSIILMSSFVVLLFLGGWSSPFPDYLVGWLYISFPPFLWFSLKIFFVIYVFIWIRSSFPRFRYDQLMNLGWKVILPLSLGMVVFYSSLIMFF